jgi:hypothetical protein
MRRALLLSLRLHLCWWVTAFSREGRRLAPLGPRRLLLLLLGYPAYLCLQALHGFGFLLDELLFPAYRRVTIKEPLFITGVPRSGTTFIQRMLAQDTERFTTFRTWEALLAPSICQRRLLRLLGRIDRACGRPLGRLLDALTRRLTTRMDDIHAVGMWAPEEDYLSLLPAAGCFILFLAFPASDSLWSLGRFQEMPDHDRRTLVGFHRRCLQKHLFVHGVDKRLLSKNAAFASWLPDLRFAYPDARYLVCVREPAAALASQLSSLRPGVAAFATERAAGHIARQIQTVLAHAYRIILDEQRSFLVDHLAVIDQRQLRRDSAGCLDAAMRRLCIPLAADQLARIAKATGSSRGQASAHRHEPLGEKAGPEEFATLTKNIYLQILENDARKHARPH